MLTLLRKIRRSLIESGSARKYLLYAIGEILLVMIGILLALQVNNWNEVKKTHLEDIAFLKNLKNELLIDTVSFHSRKVNYQAINNDIAESLKIITSEDALSEKGVALISRTLITLEFLTPLYKNIGRNDIQIAQGRLDRINPELNNKYLSYLEGFQSDWQAMNKLGESLQLMSINYIHPLVKYDYIKERRQEGEVRFNIEAIREDPKFINVFHRSFRWRQAYIGTLDSHINDVKNLLLLIDRELNKLGE